MNDLTLCSPKEVAELDEMDGPWVPAHEATALSDRIAALETALRDIISLQNDYGYGGGSVAAEMALIARAALPKEST